MYAVYSVSNLMIYALKKPLSSGGLAVILVVLRPLSVMNDERALLESCSLSACRVLLPLTFKLAKKEAHCSSISGTSELAQV